MNNCDIPPISYDLQSEFSGSRMMAQWNKAVDEQNVTKKPMKGMISLMFRVKKSIYWFALLVPLISLCGVCSPIAVNALTAFLTPASFYNCDDMFSANPRFNVLGFSDGISLAFGELWGYLLLTAVSQFLQPVLQNLGYSICIRLSTMGVNGLLDLIYQKILKISNQAVSTQAAGNLTNLLYTDTQKIAMMFTYLPQILQAPVDLVVYVIYLGV